MSAARRFPFGREPGVLRVTEDPPSRKTEPLVGFAAPTAVLPFREAPPAPPAAPEPPPVPTRSRTRRAARAWILAAFAVLVVLDAALLFLVVWGLR